jgi:hypothetical protein
VPGLLGTEADLRGMGEEWELGESSIGGGMEWEGTEKRGIFEGFGMNEEGRRALGRAEAKRLPSTVSWNCTSTVYVCVYAQCPLSPSLVTVPVIISGTEPDHMPRSVFGLHRLQVQLMP